MEPNAQRSRSVSDVSSFSTVSVFSLYTIRVGRSVFKSPSSDGLALPLPDCRAMFKTVCDVMRSKHHISCNRKVFL